MPDQPAHAVTALCVCGHNQHAHSLLTELGNMACFIAGCTCQGWHEAESEAASQREYDRCNADYREETLSDLMGDLGGW